jgi:hypothetical protein
MRKKINELPANPACSAVYRRDNGDLYLRLNDEFHVKGKPRVKDGEWIGDGSAERLDPDEEVEVVYERTT